MTPRSGATPRAVVQTLGCRLNHADSALLTGRLERAGFAVVPEDSPEFEVALLNSCAVTAEAVSKSRKAVRKLRREHPDATIIVAGCAAELDEAGFQKAGADAVLTNPGKRELEAVLAGTEVRRVASLRSGTECFQEKVLSRFPFRTRAFLKIQEGCNNFCTYCIVPYVRGPERSRAWDEVLADCRNAVAAGFPELILTGVNTCAYRDGDRDLAALTRAISEIGGEFRIRLSSTEPHPRNESLLETMAENPRICRFLHLSLQHGSDRILKAMNRHYTTADFAAFAEAARKQIPGIHLGTDVIVGFPGETDRDFEESLNFIRRIGFANVHIFTYSPRPGTPAASMPDQIPPEVARKRAEALRSVAKASAEAFARSQSGRELPVIFERESGGILRGWSDNYLEVTAPAGGFPLGRIVQAKYQYRENSRISTGAVHD